MRVLVTGPTGALGPATLAALAEAGHEVRALVRGDAPALPPQVRGCRGDITDVDAVRRAVDGADAVVHLAALLHITDPPPEMRERYYAVNVAATRTLVEAARAAGAGRLVLASTTAVYGPTREPASESTPAAPDTWYAESKLEAEAVALAAHQPGRFDVTVLRLSAVYGPRLKGNYLRLLNALAAGRFLPLGDGSSRRSLVFDRDAAAALVLALQHPRAAGALFNVSDGTPHPLREIVAAMCSALGRREPMFSVPVATARAGVRLVERVARAVGRTPPVTSSALDKYLESSVIDSRGIEAALGFAPRVDLRSGWRTTVEALRASGHLPGTAA